MYVGALCPGPVNTEFNAVANVEFALAGITPEYCVRICFKADEKAQSSDCSYVDAKSRDNLWKIYTTKSADCNYRTSAEKKAQSRGYIIRWKKLKSVPMWEWQEKRCF